MKIAVFDFDGTITSKDTLLKFIKFTKGELNFLFGLFIFSPLLIAYKFKVYPNWKIKQQIFSYFYKGTTVQQFNQWGESFAKEIEKMIRPKAISAINGHIKEGYQIVIVSASIENWIKPWAIQKGITEILATKVEINNNGKLTGRFLTANCYGEEKVRRILEVFPDRKSYKLLAYGDSRGDREIIELADKGWYNKFK
jgi:phosphatidylglycerophosphatase C